MSPTRSSTAQHRLEVVPGGGPLVPQRVLLPEGATEGAHLLSWHAGGLWTSVAVEVVASAHVPTEVVAVSEELAVDLGLDPTDPPTWRLDRVEPALANSVTLELATEGDVRDVGRDIARSRLVGQLLWVPPDGREMRLPVGGVPHRVREIDVGGRTGVVAELTAQTDIELYAPAARAGVDIVVLADGSGSMAVDDLPRTDDRAAGPGRTVWVKRINALKEALNDLLTMRLQISGRASQIALMEFDERVEHRFPRGGGMVQLDASSPPALVDEFRQAVTGLRAAGPRTNIGYALHAAANLLYQHGQPGNEKLVVLVSDGAEWRPTGEAGTGKVVHAVDEPVSLMTHLHRDMGIRLHAIGISDEKLFARRGTFDNRPALVPNHTLLEELVKVGGGDPTTTGGIDALEGYFSGLGSGIVNRVAEKPERLPSLRGALLPPTLAALRRLTSPEQSCDTQRATLHAEVSELVGRCIEAAERVLGRPPWPPQHWSAMIARDCGRTVADDAGLRGFLLGLSGALAPDRAVRGQLRALEPWSALMESLGDTVAGPTPDYRKLSRVCGDVLGTAGQAQVAVMTRVRSELSDLCAQLTASRKAEPAIPVDVRPAGPATGPVIPATATASAANWSDLRYRD